MAKINLNMRIKKKDGTDDHSKGKMSDFLSKVFINDKNDRVKEIGSKIKKGVDIDLDDNELRFVVDSIACSSGLDGDEKKQITRELRGQRLGTKT